ncbi:unnamed protein product [Paramecium primaurelia]|uniref:BZIP domain-containing protein n=2 Tax=Paramecium TaxID=5884 RepID=A0A8S1VHS9_9CILI|nr:unnamed protein product [Paramecium primaurelia]CAD8174296.1 unnamed protein product [Paramecium pentaurelia]
MTDDFFNLDFEDNCYQSCQYQFTSSRDSGMSSDDTHQKNVQIKKKNIAKKYEPIYENNIVYRYEDNPEQYKKIRKKLQNRESANRVRGRQKNYVQDMEQELLDMKKENQQLQMLNAKLQAENVVLKQQVEFMQNLIMQSQPHQSDNTLQRDTTKNSHLATLTAFSVILGFAFLNGGELESKESIMGAKELTNDSIISTPITVTHSIKPFLFGSAIALWLVYALYVVYKVFLKSKLKKKKVI